MTCVTCGTAGPAGATWCPECYLPYVRVGWNLSAAEPAMAGAPPAYGPPAYPPPYAVPQDAPPAEGPAAGSRPARFTTSKVLMVLAGVVVVPLLVIGLVAGVRHGLGCRTSSVHPDVHQVDIAVSQDNAAQSQLATGASAQGWTPAQGQAVLAADATMTHKLQGLRLSRADRVAADSFLAAVGGFDAALRTYIAAPSNPDQKAFFAAGDRLQTSIEQLDSSVHSVPQDCTNN